MTTPMRLGLVAPLLGLLAIATPAGLASQTADASQDSGPPPSPTPLEVLVKVGAAYFGNFFQAPAGESRESVRAATGELKVVQPFGSGSYVFATAGGTLYGEFDPSSNLLGGFGWSTWPHLLEAYAGYRLHTPRLDVGDTLGFANLFYLQGSYAVRPARVIQLEALIDYYDETHGQRAERDNTFLDLGGALRYRGLDHLFSPELGVAVGTRDVAADTEDFSQRTFWITVRSIPTSRLSLRARYRNRLREYSVGDAAASNFGRQDRRHQLTLSTAFSLRDELRWTVHYSFRHGTSTKASRNFDTHNIRTGLQYRLAGGRRR